jgi:hypothetical protein
MSEENKHPYLGSPGILTQVITQFRSNFPNKVDATVLQKLSLAPKNESVVITTLKFLGFIDNIGNKTTDASNVFLKHEDESFQLELSKVIKKSYSALFRVHGESSWNLDRSKLIQFFRVEDKTSELTATRQSSTFETLASLSGKTNTPIVQKQTRDTKIKTSKAKGVTKSKSESPASINDKDIGLTVRIEINLPAQGDQETYDRIFKSIRENLLK